MIEMHTINNFNSSCKQDLESLAIKIASLITESMERSNTGTYSKEEMERLGRNKTVNSILDLIGRSYLVYLIDKDDLVGTCMVVKQDNRNFIKTLHVKPKYRGLGYAQRLYANCEEFLNLNGETEVFIESLKYPKTIEFYKKRSFYEVPPYRDLKFTIFMKKDIK